MAGLQASFVSWALSQRIEGYTITQDDADHLRIAGEAATAQVNVYDLGEEFPPIVELQATKTGEDEPAFFLHFELEDLSRAQELFGEMADALREASQRTVTHVLLCCTTGMTTTMFAGKMNEVATTLGLDYDFAALPLEEALRTGNEYAAVLLAPQVGHRRKEVVEAVPDAVVIPVPGKIFGSYDAGAAVRLVLDALQKPEKSEVDGEASDLKLVRDLRNDGRVLIITVIHGVQPITGERKTSIAWKLDDKGTIEQKGKITKRGFAYQDVIDVLASLSLLGCDIKSVDRVGIAVPGAVVDGVVSMPAMGIEPYDLGGCIRKRWGVPVVIENNSRAASIGCYVRQDKYETLVFHGQRTGSPGGGEGIVIGGRVVRGKASQSGEITPLGDLFDYEEDRADLAWTPEGMCQIVARHIVAAVCMVAPEAVFVACDLIPDMAVLDEELRRHLPGDCVPELVSVPDYRLVTELGILALCLQEG